MNRKELKQKRKSWSSDAVKEVKEPVDLSALYNARMANWNRTCETSLRRTTLQREDQTKTWTRLIEKKERSINRYEPNDRTGKEHGRVQHLKKQVAHLKRLMYNINEHGNVRTSLPTLQ